MPKLNDQTEQRTPATPPKPTPTRYRHQDWNAMVAAAEGGEPHYVDEYIFSGRRFVKRDQLLNPR